MTMAEILGSGEYTSVIGVAIIVVSLFLFAFLLGDKQEEDGGHSPAPESPAVDGAAVIAAISAAVAEYRRIQM